MANAIAYRPSAVGVGVGVGSGAGVDPQEASASIPTITAPAPSVRAGARPSTRRGLRPRLRRSDAADLTFALLDRLGAASTSVRARVHSLARARVAMPGSVRPGS